MSLTTDVSLLSLQAFVLRSRTCDSKRDVCTASVDSVMDIGAYAISQHSKGNLLYSAPTAQSTMDYLSMAVEDEVVDSLPSRGAPLAVNSPSPLRGKGKLQSSELNWRDSNGVQRNLCLGLSPALHPRSVMVELSYHSMPAVCIGKASSNSKFRNESHIFR